MRRQAPRLTASHQTAKLEQDIAAAHRRVWVARCQAERLGYQGAEHDLHSIELELARIGHDLLSCPGSTGRKRIVQGPDADQRPLGASALDS